VLDAFNAAVRALASRVDTSVTESRAIGQLRDALLPRLLSGDLTVAHAVRTATEVA